MKKLFTFTILIVLGHFAYSQHYGGIYFSPDLTLNNWSGNYYTQERKYDITNGYSFGYQGLLFNDSRFSFAYGLNYSYKYLDDMGPSSLINIYDITNEAAGVRTTYHALEIPATLRFNILKGRKIQPYLSAGLAFVIPLKTKYEFINTDGSLNEISYKKPDQFHIYADFGIGLNYKVKDYIFNIQPTLRPWQKGGKFGIGFSVLKKF